MIERMNPTSKIKIFVVDDSAAFRVSLKAGLADTSNIEVVGEAADAFEARDKIMACKPDVLVMDVIMPKMDGITFLKQLMKQYPIPCVMISGMAKEKEAIDAGAAGFLMKPKSLSENKTFYTLLSSKVAIAARKVPRVVSLPLPAAKNAVNAASAAASAVSANGEADRVAQLMAESGKKFGRVIPNLPSKDDISRLSTRCREGYIVALGASTGGTDALECVLRSFPDTMPPVLVVQHMPPVFTKLYSERMDKCCTITVKEAADGDRLRQGLCLIAAGGFQMELKKDAKGYYVKCYAGEKVSGHCPSVDVLFTSFAETAGNKGIGALMTGMGADGAKGLLKMRQSGAHTIGQDKESSVVYGMPMEAYKLGACCEQQALPNIGKTICRRLTDGWN
ncbi:MAG: chemotaxis-specific protein-glutamate methyltransferase CheB [Oscillospiraceae bacterium]|nr:chemotaxis-specific protein-glutamate methyltransferase CheB [Oscillospiraceae bacterium]